MLKVYLLWTLLFVCFHGATIQAQIMVSGKVTDSTGMGIGYANVQIVAGKTYSLMTDSLGNFGQKTGKPGPIEIKATFINYQLWDTAFYAGKNVSVTIRLKAKAADIQGVVVTAGKKNIANTLVLTNKDIVLKAKGIGETDLLGLLQQKTGIVHASEVSPGIYVRGMQQGNTGIYYGETELFGISHMLGIYPQFNSDAISSADLLKADFNPHYGGYLSSYLLIKPDHQLSSKIGVKAETGILTTKLSVQLPVVKDRISAKLSVRRSYFDLIADGYNNKNSNKKDINRLSLYGFLDANASCTWHTQKMGDITLDAMTSSDHITFDETDILLDAKWKNYLISAGWEVPLSPRTNLKMDAGYSRFHLNADFKNILDSRIILNSISEGNVSAGITHQIKANLRNETGFDAKFSVVNLETTMGGYGDDVPTAFYRNLPSQNLAFYSGFQWFANTQVKIRAGLRVEFFHSDTTFINPLPYLSANYDWKGTVFNLSYSRQIQYKHLFVPTGINLPMNMWYPSQSGVPSEKAGHYNLTVSRNILKGLNLSVAAYYIHLTDLTEFLDGNYFSSLNFVTTTGRGYSRGIEVSFNLKTPRIEVEGGFSLSKSKRKFAEINNGAWFSPSFDIEHKADLSIVYKPAKKWTFTLSQFIQDGFVMTLPTSIYLHQTADAQGNLSTKIVPVYTTRYNFRMPLSHRLDISASYDFRWGRTNAGFTLGIYNVYNYQNPYFIYFITKTDADMRKYLEPKKKSLLPLVPFASFKVSF